MTHQCADPLIPCSPLALSDSGTFLAEAIIAITSSSSFWYVLHAAILYLVVHFSGCLQVFFAHGSVFFANDVDDDEDGSWLVRSGLSGKSVEEQYAGALVHALLQMLLVAPGLVAPVGQSEYWFYFISVLVGGFFLTHLIASLTARHVAAQFGSQGEYNRRMDDLQRYMDHHQFKPELRQHVRIHQELKYPGGHCFDEETILRNLSRPLQEKTRVHTCRALMAKLQIPLETEQGFELAASLALRLNRRVFLPGDYLIKQGTVPDGMFFITSHPGEVEILKREELVDALDTYKRIPFTGGKIVGEISLLRQTKATAFVRAKTVCDTEMLSKEAYNQLVDSFPLFKEYLQQVATSRGFSDYTKAMANYDRLEPPKTITMVKIAALQDCKELNQTGVTSFGILEDFYESYRTPEGVVLETLNTNRIIGKICSDGSLCHQDTGKVLEAGAVHTVRADGSVVGPNGKPVGQMRPDACRGVQDGRVFDGLVFDKELNSWMPAGQAQKSISKLLPDDAFVKVAFEELGATTYGVLTYPWIGMPWRDILLKLKGTELEFFWIDIFCVNQALAPDEKMKTIKQTVTLYSKASEHHILGYRTLRRGWCVHHHHLHRVPFAHTLRHRSCQSPCRCLCELSARREGKTMDHMFEGITVHTGFENTHTQASEEEAIEFFGQKGAPTFDTCEFSKETDRPLVAKLIKDLWNRVAFGSNRVGIEAFNDFLLELIKKVCPQAVQGGTIFTRLNKGNRTPTMRQLRRHAVAPKAHRDLRSKFPEFYEGVRVKHGKRGEGVVTGIDEDTANSRQTLVVEFDAADSSGVTVHRYGAHSLHKLKLI